MKSRRGHCRREKLCNVLAREPRCRNSEIISKLNLADKHYNHIRVAPGIQGWV